MTPVEAPEPGVAVAAPKPARDDRSDTRPPREARPSRETRALSEAPPALEANVAREERAPRRDPRRDEPRRDDPRRDEGRGRRDRDDLGPSVVGFGHELPAFLLTSFTVPAAQGESVGEPVEKPRRARKPAIAATDVDGAPKPRRARRKAEAPAEA